MSGWQMSLLALERDACLVRPRDQSSAGSLPLLQFAEAQGAAVLADHPRGLDTLIMLEEEIAERKGLHPHIEC